MNLFLTKWSEYQKILSYHKRDVVLVAGGLLAIIFLIVIINLHPKPPSQKIAQGRMALSHANHVDAEKYAPKTFTEAKQNWEKSLRIWRRENNKIFFKRNYQQLEQLAEQTKLLAQESERQAIRARDSLKNVAKVELVLLLEKVNEFKTKYDQMPIDESLRKKMVRGELLVLEGQAALKRQDVKKALSKFKAAETLIGQSGKEVSEMLTEYLKNIPVWRKWAKETIDSSKARNDVAIVVDKFDHSLHVYDKAQLIKKYPVELGKNWMGHKRQRGDNATPEGQYFITKKIGNGQSKYYKALVLNYPNKRDLERFFAAKSKGELSKDTQIGGLIEIHGEGGKGINWTQGCIALKNDDLDKIFGLVKVGTPVTIVGSLNGMTNNKTSQASVSK